MYVSTAHNTCYINHNMMNDRSTTFEPPDMAMCQFVMLWIDIDSQLIIAVPQGLARFVDHFEIRHLIALQWHHNGRNSVWNHQTHACLLNRLFGCRSKKTSQLRVIVRRAGLLLSQQDFEWRWSVPLFQCLTVLEFSFILFDLCLLITFFNFIMNYVPIVTFWIFTYHKIWILSIMFCFIWSYWIIYFLACL